MLINGVFKNFLRRGSNNFPNILIYIYILDVHAMDIPTSKYVTDN